MVQLNPKTPSSLPSFKSRLVLPFWYWLTQVVLEKRLLNGCSSSSSSKKGKGSLSQLSSIGFRSWFWFLAISLQVTRVIHPVVSISHKPDGRLPLLSARPAVTPATLNSAATNFAAWWTEAWWVWTVCLRRYPTASWVRFELRPFCTWVLHANHFATEPPLVVVVVVVVVVALLMCSVWNVTVCDWLEMIVFS